MCFALLIAAGSFFVGQAHTFPEALRQPALLAVPVLVPLLAMPYWVWRLRRRKPARLLDHLTPC
jgi:ABC-type Fe3+-siderophore transport system permease subunit